MGKLIDLEKYRKANKELKNVLLKIQIMTARLKTMKEDKTMKPKPKPRPYKKEE